MNLDFADLVATGYLVWGARKGYRRGLSIELPRLASVTLALVTGAGLTRWTDHLLTEANKFMGHAARMFGWGVAIVGAFYLARHFREQMGRWITARLPEPTIQKRAGLATGLLRTLVISFIVTLFLLHSPLAFVVRDSAIGHLARIIQPVYHMTDRPQD